MWVITIIQSPEMIEVHVLQPSGWKLCTELKMFTVSHLRGAKVDKITSAISYVAIYGCSA